MRAGLEAIGAGLETTGAGFAATGEGLEAMGDLAGPGRAGVPVALRFEAAGRRGLPPARGPEEGTGVARG